MYYSQNPEIIEKIYSEIKKEFEQEKRQFTKTGSTGKIGNR